MGQYEIEVVPIPVPQKPKGRWDDFIETMQKLRPWSDESIFVPLGDAKSISSLKEKTSKALNKAGLKAVSHQEEYPLRGGVGLRFWSKASKRGRPKKSEEEIKKNKAGYMKKYNEKKKADMAASALMQPHKSEHNQN